MSNLNDQIKAGNSYNNKRKASAMQTSSSNESPLLARTRIVFNPKTAKPFSGSNFSDFAVFISRTWIPFANHHQVLEVIREGTIEGHLTDDLKTKLPTLLESKVKYVNKLLFEKCQSGGQIYDFYKGIILCHPILQYLLTKVITIPGVAAIPANGPAGVAIAAILEVSTCMDIPVGAISAPYEGMPIPPITMPINIGAYESLLLLIPYASAMYRAQIRTNPAIPTLFEKYWGFIPNFANIPEGTINSRRIYPYMIHEFIQKICEIIYDRDSLSYEIEQSLVLDDKSNFDIILNDGVNSLEMSLITDKHNVEKSNWKKQDQYLTDKNDRCNTVMQLLGTTCTSHIAKLIELKQWHTGWNSVLQLMASKGISDISNVDLEVQSIVIEKGEDWDNFLERFQEGNAKLATLRHLRNQSLLPGFVLAKHKFNTEMVSDNCYDKTDAEILAIHKCVLIDESTRVTNLIKAISHSKRFEFVYNLLAGWKIADKTMRAVIEHIGLNDCSTLGQSLYQEELSEISAKKPKHTALVTENKVFEEGSCEHHPKSTTHNTSMCRGGDSSKQTPKPKKPYSAGNKKYNSDEILPGPHKCKYCIVNHPRIHKTHPLIECTKDPKSSCYKKPFIKKGADDNTSNKKFSALDAKIDKIALMLKNATTEDDST